MKVEVQRWTENANEENRWKLENAVQSPHSKFFFLCKVIFLMSLSFRSMRIAVCVSYIYRHIRTDKGWGISVADMFHATSFFPQCVNWIMSTQKNIVYYIHLSLYLFYCKCVSFVCVFVLCIMKHYPIWIWNKPFFCCMCVCVLCVNWQWLNGFQQILD